MKSQEILRTHTSATRALMGVSSGSDGSVAPVRLYGDPACFGADPRWASLPISNVPDDAVRVRRRVRPDAFAKAYVKTETDLQEWILAPDGPLEGCNTIRLAYRLGTNATTSNPLASEAKR